MKLIVGTTRHLLREAVLVSTCAAALVAGVLAGVTPVSARSTQDLQPRQAGDAGQISTVYTDTGSDSSANQGTITGLNIAANKIYLAENHADIKAADLTAATPAWQQVPLTDAAQDTFAPVDIAPASDGSVYFTNGSFGNAEGSVDKAAPGGQVTQLATGWTEAGTSHVFDFEYSNNGYDGGAIRLDPTGQHLYVTTGQSDWATFGRKVPLVELDTATPGPGRAVTSDFDWGLDPSTLAIRNGDAYVAVMDDTDAGGSVFDVSLGDGGVTTYATDQNADPVDGQPLAGHAVYMATGITTDAAGNVFLAFKGMEGTLHVWKIDGPHTATPGIAHLIAGETTAGSPDAASASAGTSATDVSLPYDYWGNPLAVDDAGNLYVGAGANVFKIAHVAAVAATLNVSINSGSGTVTDATHDIDCTSGGTAGCSGTFAQGSTVTLTATPAAGYEATWSGCTLSPDPPLILGGDRLGAADQCGG